MFVHNPHFTTSSLARSQKHRLANQRRKKEKRWARKRISIIQSNRCFFFSCFKYIGYCFLQLHHRQRIHCFFHITQIHLTTNGFTYGSDFGVISFFFFFFQVRLLNILSILSIFWVFFRWCRLSQSCTLIVWPSLETIHKNRTKMPNCLWIVFFLPFFSYFDEARCAAVNTHKIATCSTIFTTIPSRDDCFRGTTKNKNTELRKKAILLIRWA